MESFIRSTWNWSKNLHNHDIKIEKNYLIYILIKTSITTIHMHSYVRIKKLRAFSANSESHVGSRVRKEAKAQAEKYLPERGRVFVACQPGCSPSMPRYRNPFPWLVCSWVWTRETVGTLSGCPRRMACQGPIRENNVSAIPRRARRNYWMSNEKSPVPDGSRRSTLTTRFPASKRLPPLRSCPPCRPEHLQTKSSHFTNGGLPTNNDRVAQSLKYIGMIYGSLVKINV